MSRIPRNPNQPAPLLHHGLQPRWINTTVLLLIAVALNMLSGSSAGWIVFDTPRPLVYAAPQPIRLAPTPPLATPAPLVGTARRQPTAEQQVQRVVTQALNMLGSARAGATANNLAQVGTGAWLTDEQAYIADLRARSASEDWQQLGLQFGSTTLNEREASVCTSEHWRFVLTEPGSTANTSGEAHYFVRYSLVNSTDSWLVYAVVYLEEMC